ASTRDRAGPIVDARFLMARPFQPLGTPAHRPRPARERSPWQSVAILVVVACFALYAWQAVTAGEPVGGGLLLMPMLFLVTAPVLVGARRSEPTFDLAGLMATGLALRCVGAYFRWANAADAHIYHRVGAELAVSFRSLDFAVDTGRPVPGTGGLRYIAGLVSVPANSDEFLTFLIFTWFAFWGSVLFYRAFTTALPDADRSRYAKLIFLWPALVFWPSSIGKESWMMLTLGLAMLGAARALRRQRGGYSLLVAGMLGMSLVRPHVAFLALAAFAVAFFVGRRADARPGVITPGSVGKVAGLVVVLALGGLVAGRTAELLGTEDLSPSSLESARARTGVMTGQGGSQFPTFDPNSPVGYTKSLVTTLVRPFPTEAQGSEQWATTAEGLLLAALLLTSWRRLLTIPRRLRREPYVALALAYVLLFAYTFSAISNFGILARQRVQVLPFVFVLLALPAVLRPSAVEPSGPVATSAPD
ncbi:MAG: hypothetical protein R6X23_00970, partial [Acidimicrobiia bacterium]